MKKIFLASLLAASAVGASAQFYSGAGVGVTSLKLDCTGTVGCSKSDVSLKAYAGYKLTHNLAAELAYSEFGTSKLHTSVNGGVVDTIITSSGLTATAVVRYPVMGSLTAVGRLGATRVRTRADNQYQLATTSSSVTTKTKPYVGVGLEYPLGKGWSGALAADFTQATAEGSKGALRMVSWSAQYDY